MKSTAPARRRFSTRLILIALALFSLVVGTAYAGGWLARAVAGFTTKSAVKPHAQGSPRARRVRARNHALQPEAQRFSRRVGQRFLEPGRESSMLVGQLNVGGDQRHVRILRLQGDDGERVEVSFAGRQETLSWDAERGPLSSEGDAEGDARVLLERLVLDSPDQFALAQLRGASYYTVARSARPTNDGGADGYKGPLYDLVRVGEPGREDGKGWSSPWRLYHVNTATGLVEKIVSEEGGTTVEAVLSDWGTHAGEKLPARITWASGGQVFMELTLQNVTHGPGR
jgi:hypothetical protein